MILLEGKRRQFIITQTLNWKENKIGCRRINNILRLKKGSLIFCVFCVLASIIMHRNDKIKQILENIIFHAYRIFFNILRFFVIFKWNPLRLWKMKMKNFNGNLFFRPISTYHNVRELTFQKKVCPGSSLLFKRHMFGFLHCSGSAGKCPEIPFIVRTLRNENSSNWIRIRIFIPVNLWVKSFSHPD